ncbi:MAG: hypothetical protein WA989_09470 [Henriciella sp.]|uniref:hypothetical protein n=1 Tax=Henriciella sp. TaxID=1968823 RepID=UPI003C763D3F
MTDLIEPVGPDEDGGGGRVSLLRRLAWFAGLALISLSVVAATAYILRGFLLLG